jgi:hypothetical protein
MTAATNLVQTEVPAPAYKLVADQIIAITLSMREQGHDQDTVRAALHVFAEASRATPGGTPALCEPPRRY